MDASLLLIPLVGFLPADDERVVATVEAIQRDLTEDGLVLRYATEQRAGANVDGRAATWGCSPRSTTPSPAAIWATTRRRSACGP
ncbi:glycoside hydrolase family 15 protein [Kitasatospora sp. NRRL B-11411]|uniref:glycoside hydrolase family 15 protein n=1 Tax=Kitasatospora sp. NRRL B-11411 TaxID=1463822 RepID=UPI00350F7680